MVRFKLSPDPLVVWSVVVTLQIAEKAKLKHTVKCVRLSNMISKEKSYNRMLNHGGIFNRQSDSKRQTFGGGRVHFFASAPSADNTSYATAKFGSPRISLAVDIFSFRWV